MSIKLKSLTQKIWVVKFDWDENLSTDLADNYLDWRSKLFNLGERKVSRFVLKEKQTGLIAMHGFSDASVTAYGACIYVVENENSGWRATMWSL